MYLPFTELSITTTSILHKYNKAYSTKTSPKLHRSITRWCPRGVYYVTSGSTLQSRQHCNCMVCIPTSFCAFWSHFKPQRWQVSRQGNIRIILTPKEHFIRALCRTPVIEFRSKNTLTPFVWKVYMHQSHCCG